MTALARRTAEVETQRAERRRWMKEHMPAAYASYVEWWKLFETDDEDVALSGFMAEENGHAITIGGNPRINGDDSTCGCCYLYQCERSRPKENGNDVHKRRADVLPSGVPGLARTKLLDMVGLRSRGN